MNMDEILEHIEMIEQVSFRLHASGIVRADDLNDLEESTESLRLLLSQYDQ